MSRIKHIQTCLLREKSALLAATKVEDLVNADVEINHVLLADRVDDLLNHLHNKA